MILGDPHGDHAALDALLEREPPAPETAFLSVGDNVGYAGGAACSEFVRRLWALDIRSVEGNHEDWLSPEGRLAICNKGSSDRHLDAEVAAWTRTLPRQLRCEFEAAPGLSLLLTHTLDARPAMKWPYVDRATVHRVGEDLDADLIVLGHTHRPRLYRPQGAGWREELLDLEGPGSLRAPLEGRLFADAGSLARPEQAESGPAHHLATYVRVDLRAREVELIAIAKG